MVGTRKRLKAQDIGASAVEDEEDPTRGAEPERLAKLSYSPGGPRIFAVGVGIALTRVAQRVQNQRMGARVVVAAEALSGISW